MVGSDAHSGRSFALGLGEAYAIAAAAGFEALTFRRGGRSPRGGAVAPTLTVRQPRRRARWSCHEPGPNATLVRSL